VIVHPLRHPSAPLVASLQRIFCSFQGTSNFGLRQARRVLSFAYRDGAGFKTIEFSNPASRSASMPAVFSMTVVPKEPARRGGRVEAVVWRFGRAECDVHSDEPFGHGTFAGSPLIFRE
jgi:hypothetical protein